MHEATATPSTQGRLPAPHGTGDGRDPGRPFSLRELEGLPDPVRRYFGAALWDGQPVIRSARVVQAGEFRTRLDSESWQPFDAVESFDLEGCGFEWDARIRLGPGLRLRVVDRLRDGTACMRASVLGLIPVARAQHTPELAAGSLQRYLAEAVLCPTALLPRHGVSWTALDAGRARASLALGTTRVSLDFSFGADGLVERVDADARARAVDRGFVDTPWRGHWCDYRRQDGMQVPQSGWVEWVLADGPQAYWRGRMEAMSFEYF
jgi:hypothetical protein